MKISFRKIPPPSGQWYAFVLFWTVVVFCEIAYPFFFTPNPEAVKVLKIADFLACVFFLADVVWRWLANSDKLGFWKWGWIDLVSALPFMTFLRFGRIASAARIIRNYGLGNGGRRGNFFANAFAATFFLSAVLLCGGMLLSSVLVLHFESESADANIKSYFDALWWAVDTVSTVGYGDVYPITTQGRYVAMGLMFCGIGLFSLNAALLSSWLLRKMGGSADTPPAKPHPQNSPPRRDLYRNLPVNGKYPYEN